MANPTSKDACYGRHRLRCLFSAFFFLLLVVALLDPVRGTRLSRVMSHNNTKGKRLPAANTHPAPQRHVNRKTPSRKPVVTLSEEAFQTTLANIKSQRDPALQARLVLVALAAPNSVQINNPPSNKKFIRACLSRHAYVYDKIPYTRGSRLARFLPVSHVRRSGDTVQIRAVCEKGKAIRLTLRSSVAEPGSHFAQLLEFIPPTRETSIAVPADSDLDPGSTDESAKELIDHLFGKTHNKPESAAILLSAPVGSDNKLSTKPINATIMLSVPCGAQPESLDYMCGPTAIIPDITV